MARADVLDGAKLSEIVAALGGGPVEKGRCRAWYRDGDNPGSLALDDKRGVFFDHVLGVGGGVLDLIGLALDLDRRAAAEWLKSYSGPLFTNPAPATRRPPADRVDDGERTRRALQLWGDAGPLEGTLGARYLASRGLDCEGLDHALRFLPRCPFGEERLPCIVALMRDAVTDEPTGIHRTALSLDGAKIGRKMLGRAGVVMIDESADVTLGLGIAEGIETALSVRASGWRPVWACLSAGGIERFPPLDGIEHLTVFADNDEAGLRAARLCAGYWRASGRRAAVRAPAAAGEDFNDRNRRGPR